MKLRRYGIPSALAALLTASGMAHAQFSPIEPYVGAGVGQSRFDTDSGTLGAAGVDDDKDTAWRIFAGTRVWNFVGVELGYIDFGEIKGRTGGTKVDARGIDLVAVGFVPLVAQGPHGFDAFVKAGAYWWDADTSGAPLVGSNIDTTDDFDWTAGAGVQYTFGGMNAGKLGVRAEWQHYHDTFGNVDNGVWMGSVLWQF